MQELSRESISKPIHEPWQVRIRNIVVGFDFDDTEMKATSVARLLAREYDAALSIVHSVPPPPDIRTMAVPPPPPNIISRTLADSKKRIALTLKMERKFRGIRYRLDVGFESPLRLLLDTAKEKNADLLIVGSHGRHGFGHLLLGSVSESLLRRAECPVLILGPEFDLEQNAFRTVLFATDLSDTGIRAAQHAGRVASDWRADLVMLHVPDEKPNAEGRTREWFEDNCKDKLWRLLEPVDRDTCDHEALIAYGDPAQEILAAADAKHADLIVMGAGEHGVLSDHAPWRTLTEVARCARCPILCVGYKSK